MQWPCWENGSAKQCQQQHCDPTTTSTACEARVPWLSWHQEQQPRSLQCPLCPQNPSSLRHRLLPLFHHRFKQRCRLRPRFRWAGSTPICFKTRSFFFFPQTPCAAFSWVEFGFLCGSYLFDCDFSFSCLFSFYTRVVLYPQFGKKKYFFSKDMMETECQN